RISGDDNGNGHFDGEIGDPQVYDRALSAAELLTVMADDGAHGNTIIGNLIGTNAAGTAALGNGGNGVTISGSVNNPIGGTTSADRNVISGNDQNGVNVNGAAAVGNVIEGNYIGTDVTGTSSVPNGLANNFYAGVQINDASGNTVGGTTAGARNVISGNGSASSPLVYGVEIAGGSGNFVQGNYIGVDASGSHALGNGRSGIDIGSSADNTVGGTATGAGNVISANGESGVYIQYAQSTGNLVEGNLIGTDASGTTALGGNSLAGVTIDGAPDNVVGGTTTAARNVISGNSGPGVLIQDSQNTGAATGNLVEGNYIGTDLSGTVKVPNAGSGVNFSGLVSGNTVSGNLISGNTGDGATLNGATTPGGLAGWWQGEGNANDVSGNGDNGTLVGNVTFAPGKVGEAFSFPDTASDVDVGNPAALQLQNFTIAAWIKTDVSLIPGGGERIFGYRSGGYTFVVGGGQFGDGVGQLVLTENGVSNIHSSFAISDDNWHFVAVTKNGPTVTFYLDGVAETPQTYNPTFTFTTDALIGGNGNGELDEVQVYGTPLSAANIGQLHNEAAGETIVGNLIGTTAAGTAALANGGNGVSVDNHSNNTIGGTATTDRNVISGNAGDGILVTGATAVGNVIVGNYVGASAPIPAGVTAEYATPSANPGNNKITLGPDGNLWFTESTSDKIGRITPAGTITEFAVPTANSTPQGITAGPDGNLWFTEQNGNQIGRLTTSGVFTEFSTGLSAGSVPSQITAGPDGNLWFTEQAGNRIGRITTSGVITEFSTGLSANSSPGGIAAGSDGNLWFTEQAGDRIGRITTSGTVTEFAIPTANSQPYSITVGPDGNLWFTEHNGNKIGVITPAGTITEFTVPTPASEPYGIITGPDGNLWFGEIAANKIAEITVSGAITEYAVPTANSAPGAELAVDNQGAIWFTENNGNKIGQITFHVQGVGNGVDGVALQNGAASNTIGGTTAGNGNVISGNSSDGVFIDAASSLNTVAGNLIGTNTAGTAGLPNAGNGVEVAGFDNVVGGTTAAARNVISGNLANGVLLNGSSSSGNLVEGNYTGADVTGTAGLGNLHDGVAMQSGANRNTIGGTATGAGNVIAADHWDGILVDTTSNANTIVGNDIGVGANGTAALGNLQNGISLNGPNNMVGGTATGAANIVANDADAGVLVHSASATGDAIRANSIYANGKLGIDLGGSGVPLPNNTAGPGPNNNQNYPVITSVTFGNVDGFPDTTVMGTLNGAPNTTYTIDLYANPAADPSKHGQGQTYLDSITLGTDSNGAGSFNDTIFYDGTALANGGQQQAFSATATDPSGNTSEFSLDSPTPTVTVAINAPAAASQGESLELTSSVTDSNAGTTFVYNWSVTTPTGSVLSLGNDANQPNLQLDPLNVGVYTVTLMATDSLGNAARATALIDVSVPAPAIVIQNNPSGPAPGTGLVNQPIALTGTLVAPVGDTISTYNWSVSKDGQPYSLPAGTVTSSADFTFTPTAAGNYVIQLLATDANGGTAAALDDVLVTTATPLAEITQVPAGPIEGAPMTLANAITSGSLTGTLTYAWSVTKDGVSYDAGTPTNQPTFTFTPDDEGSYQVSLHVSNRTNSGIAPPVTIQVADAPLTTTITDATTGKAPTSNVQAGTPISLFGVGGTASTIDAPSLTWSVSDSAGQDVPGGSGGEFGFIPHAAGLYLVTLTAADGTQTATSSVAFNVGAPAIGVQLIPSGDLTEGGQVTVTAIATPSSDYGYFWTVTDQSAPVSVSTTPDGNAVMFSPPTAGSYLVSVTVDNGAASITTTRVVQVVNEPPTTPAIIITSGGTVLVPNPSVPEGTALNLSAASTDPGGSFDTLTYSWRVSGPEGFTQVASGPTFNFTPTESGEYSVTAAATDSNGATTISQTAIDVTHVQPTPTIEVNSVTRGDDKRTVINVRANVPDPGGDEQFSFNYDWTAVDPSGVTVASVSGAGLSTFSFSEAANDPGVYTVSVRVTDDEGGDQTTTAPFVSAGDNQTVTIATSTDGHTTVAVDGTIVTTVTSSQGAQVIAVADGSGVTIDASKSTVPVVEAALGGHDTLLGGSGPNVLQGDSGFNSLMGGSGPNTLYASGGDTLLGGQGGNTNMFNVLTNPAPPSGPIPIPYPNIQVTAGATANTLSFAASPVGVNVDLTSTGTQKIDTSLDQLQLAGAFQNLMGSAGADTLVAAPNSTVYGGGGSDTLMATGGGNIALISGSQRGQGAMLEANGVTGALLFGGMGNDSVNSSGAVSISMYGGSGSDSLGATGGTSVSIQAGSGNSSLYASGGSSLTLFGGMGNDSLSSTGATSVSMYATGGSQTLPPSGGSSISLFG
ncbi:MAG TPA: PKD domain-containing protein, partial [Pirellulales bacterium]|nr:PKD domain-containing protein [Pirellulales bacterium]